MTKNNKSIFSERKGKIGNFISICGFILSEVCMLYLIYMTIAHNITSQSPQAQIYIFGSMIGVFVIIFGFMYSISLLHSN